jgi:membrane protease YdiL (CAAX protease family)
MATYELRSATTLDRADWPSPAVAFAACVAIGLGNDVLFNAVRGTQAIYPIDYALKALMLFVALKAVHRLSPVRGQRRRWFLLFGVLVVCIAAGLLSQHVAPIIGDAWRLFEWPPISWPFLRAFDLTAGLLLSAAAEELVYRRLALAVLPFGSRGNLVASAVLFGLIHWGNGLGIMAATTLSGFFWGFAYQRTGSLALVITAHYIVDFVIFL